jgi:antitoxin VapB
MAIHIREAETDFAVRELANRLGVSLTEAIRISAVNELKRVNRNRVPLSERVKKIQARLSGYERTGLKADKAFFDDLSGGV